MCFVLPNSGNKRPTIYNKGVITQTNKLSL